MRSIFFALFLLAQSLAPFSQKPTLFEAIQKKLVTAEAIAKGGTQNDAITLRLTNPGKKALTLLIPAGQMLMASDSSQQNLISVKEQTLTLEPGKTRLLKLDGYCAELGDASPGVNAKFLVAASAAGKLGELAQFLNAGYFTGSDIQASVWVVTDASGPENIGDPALREFTARLVGAELKPYVIQREMRPIPPAQPARLGKTLSAKGKLDYTVDRMEILTYALFDSSGAQVLTLRRDVKKYSGEHFFEFSMRLDDQKPGTYWMRIVTATKKVLAEMEIKL